MASRRSPTDIHTLPKLKGLRRALRHRLTPAEATFWNIVKNSKLDGRKFRRQHSIGNFIFDFYCPAERLAIELDGEGHYTDHPRLNDRSKRLFAESQGIRLLRFENRMIFEETEWVIALIRKNFDWWRVEGATPAFKSESGHVENHPVSPD